MLSRRRVYTLLPDRALGRLRPLLEARHTLQAMSSVEPLLERFHAGDGGIVVLNPALLRIDAIRAVCDAARYAGTRIIGYAAADDEVAQRSLDLLDLVPSEIVFEHPNDDFKVLGILLNEPSRWSVPGRLLHALAPTFRQLPVSLFVAGCCLFAWRPIPTTATAFFGATGEDRRKCERRLHRVGLAGASALLACARLAKAWEFGRGEGANKYSIARDSGIGSVRTLDAECRRILGRSLRQARAEFDDDTCAQFLASRATRTYGESA